MSRAIWQRVVAWSLCAGLLAAWPVAALTEEPSYQLRVDGLACPFCSYGIEKELVRIEGVERAETDLGAGVVVVTVKEGAALDEETAREAVARAGFTLRGFEAVDPDAEAE